MLRRTVAVAGATVAVVAMLVAGSTFAFSTAFAPSVPPTSPPAVAVVGDSHTLRETFDYLPMASRLAAPWAVEGDGPVAVVALPTSVDRSVRIGSTGTGAATAVCRPTGSGEGRTLRVAFDYLLGRPPVGEVALVTLRTGAGDSLRVLIDTTGTPSAVLGPDGAVAGTSGTAGLVAARAGAAEPAWRRLEITVDAAAQVVAWEARDASGTVAASGSASAPAASAGFEAVCLHSPDGSPAGWLAVNDLIIEG